MIKLITGALLFLVVFALPAAAVPIQWTAASGGNDHYYDLVFASNITWTAADTAAAGLSHLGLPGHLATITSAAENTFIIDNLVSSRLVGTDIGPWFGAFQPDGQSSPTVNWQWVTGEPWSFTSWRPHDPAIYPFPEPNDVDNVENNQENYGHFHSPGSAPWAWNDAPNFLSGMPGYLVEFEPGPTVVPEPTTMTLVGLGLVAARYSRRRRR